MATAVLHGTAAWLPALVLCASSIYTIAFSDPIEDLPDIHTQSLLEYSSRGDFSAEMGIRMSIYLDSLESELERLSLEIEEELAMVPGQQESFREAHTTFLTYAEAWSCFAEDIEWVDLRTGEQNFGSGLGYMYIRSLAALYWERIVLYRALAGGGLEIGLGEITVPSDRIGGY